MKKVIIVGAGFSIRAGIPLQSEILPTLINTDETLLTFSSKTIVRDFKIIKDIILPYIYGEKYKSKCELILLEDLYTLFDNAIQSRSNIGFLNYSLIIRVRIALDNCVKYVIDKSVSESMIRKYTKKIESIIKNSKVSFISTNWDNILEIVLEKLGYSIDFGIGKIPKGRKIIVLKPHGSFNWKWCPVCHNFFSDAGNIFYCTECEPVFNSVYNDKLLSIDEDKVSNQLLSIFITPTFMKSGQLFYIHTINQKILNLLSGADEINFIGYSLPISDHDIREILIKANTLNPTQNVSVTLKEKKKERKELLIRNFTSIYQSEKINFNWDGFFV